MKFFENRLLTEGLRAIEGNSLTLPACIKSSAEKSFESLLFERAQNHEKSAEVSQLFLHFNKIIRTTSYLLFVIVFIVGGIAVNNVLFANPSVSVNFFWAFALFFIPNIFMFVVWMLFFMQPQWLQNSSLEKLFLMFIKQFEGYFNKHSTKQTHYQPLFLCYFNIHFGKVLGRYQLSKLTHLLWLGYFCGATLMSVVMLATHQVDFIWQTSILSSDAFQSLTHLLAYLPQKLTLPVPTVEQIQQSYFTTDNLLEAENRRLAWSSLLISSLFLYGLLPRFIFFILMRYRFNKIKAQYQLNFSDLYYVKLRQLLKPNKTTLGITDADDETASYKKEAEQSPSVNNTPLSLPNNSYPIAIELSSRQLGIAIRHQYQYDSQQAEAMINVCDYQTQRNLLQELYSSEKRTVVLYLALSRLPDRGLKRFISELMGNTNQTFYLLLISEDNRSSVQQRDSDWYQLANEVGIKFDNIHHIEQQENTK